jgi:hypothetical protein
MGTCSLDVPQFVVASVELQLKTAQTRAAENCTDPQLALRTSDLIYRG